MRVIRLLTIYLSAYLTIYLSIYLPTYLSIHPSISATRLGVQNKYKVGAYLHAFFQELDRTVSVLKRSGLCSLI
jgi:hypothetical protein